MSLTISSGNMRGPEEVSPIYAIKLFSKGNSLAGQWLGLSTSTAEDPASIPGWGTKILQAVPRDQKKKKNCSQRQREKKCNQNQNETMYCSPTGGCETKT